jgi:hypothetical protein
VRNSAHRYYDPISFWEEQEYYVEMAVEKIDLQSLFSEVCEEFHVPLTNVSGWMGVNSRAAILQRFAKWEGKGKKCVLLFCGDHDPGGLQITDFLHSNLKDLERAAGFSPDNLIIKRFGLNADFIKTHGLTWIDNLETSSGGDLGDHRHNDHNKPYVRDYIKRFGARKVEANALVVQPVAGRELCRNAILQYVSTVGIERWQRRVARARNQMRRESRRLLKSQK